MIDFSKKSCVEEYVSSLLNDIKNVKIKAIFSLEPMMLFYYKAMRRYSTDSEIYILLEDDNCIVINYLFIDNLDIQFRKLTSIEQVVYDNMLEKDWFNIINDTKLEYGSITNISLRPVEEEYSKWIDDDIDFVMPTEETFDQIKFTMDNGKSFIICADYAESDGYGLLWSEDATTDSKK